MSQVSEYVEKRKELLRISVDMNERVQSVRDNLAALDAARPSWGERLPDPRDPLNQKGWPAAQINSDGDLHVWRIIPTDDIPVFLAWLCRVYGWRGDFTKDPA